MIATLFSIRLAPVTRLWYLWIVDRSGLFSSALQPPVTDFRSSSGNLIRRVVAPHHPYWWCCGDGFFLPTLVLQWQEECFCRPFVRDVGSEEPSPRSGSERSSKIASLWSRKVVVGKIKKPKDDLIGLSPRCRCYPQHEAKIASREFRRSCRAELCMADHMTSEIGSTEDLAATQAGGVYGLVVKKSESTVATWLRRDGVDHGSPRRQVRDLRWTEKKDFFSTSRRKRLTTKILEIYMDPNQLAHGQMEWNACVRGS
jgi:hypothetical protein